MNIDQIIEQMVEMGIVMGMHLGDAEIRAATADRLEELAQILLGLLTAFSADC